MSRDQARQDQGSQGGQGSSRFPGLSAVAQALAAASPGDKVTLTVSRDGENRDVQVTLGELPAS